MVKILFLCTGNSCRSQMAEGWARHLKAGAIHAKSAGVEKKGLDPLAVKVMAESGVDISDHKSKLVNDLDDQTFDYVITVCDNAAETCPIFPGDAKIVHHGFDDPPALVKKESMDETEALMVYRRVREEISDYVLGLPESLPA